MDKHDRNLLLLVSLAAMGFGVFLLLDSKKRADKLTSDAELDALMRRALPPEPQTIKPNDPLLEADIWDSIFE